MAVRRMKRVPRRPRRKAARKGGRKTTIPRGINDNNQVARIKETVAFGNIDAATAYSFVFSLNQFRRASTLAPNFKWYKASKVEWVLEPLFNTFTDDGTPQTVPYMYMTMNRTQDAVGLNLQDLQAMGAKPKKLTSKQTLAYRPNWCSPGLLSFSRDTNAYVREIHQNGLKPQYAWLSCPNLVDGISPFPQSQSTPIENGFFPVDPDMVNVLPAQVVYNGHNIYIDQALSSTLPVARLICTVHWEFKGPHYTASPDAGLKTVKPIVTGEVAVTAPPQAATAIGGG